MDEAGAEPGDRLTALRARLAAAGLDGMIVPIADEHGSEYVGDYARRLCWLTGFTGSAGTAVVLAERALFFTDGRYTQQAAAETGAIYEAVNSVARPVTRWLEEETPPGARIGFDAWNAPRATAEGWRSAVEARGGRLVALAASPIDALWNARPAPSSAPARAHPPEFAGKSAADKRALIAAALRTRGADSAVVSTLDGVGWAFNLRGDDVPGTPVVRAHALLHADASADLFIDRAKLGVLATALGADVRVHDYDAFAPALAGLGGRAVLVDPERAVAAVFDALGGAGARVIEGRDPTLLPKAIKNAAEIGGAHEAHAHDGVAVARFLHWLAEGDLTGVDELAATARLLAFRRESPAFLGPSFDTIMGSGRNGALMHYRATEASNRGIAAGDLLLVDSGGQYAMGTTDVTRTVAVGGAADSDRVERFTRVLKGHIAVASAVFPDGAKGAQLDGLARRALWAIGADYAHGTGHGVGAALAVHEGPQRIATYGGGDEPLRAGMILSNEPGYYRTGAYGIRIENLVLIEPVALRGAEAPMLGFTNLTLAPIDRALIDPALLDEGERDWVNAYHALVRRELSSRLETDVAAWLARVTAPL